MILLKKDYSFLENLMGKTGLIEDKRDMINQSFLFSSLYLCFPSQLEISEQYSEVISQLSKEVEIWVEIKQVDHKNITLLRSLGVEKFVFSHEIAEEVKSVLSPTQIFISYNTYSLQKENKKTIAVEEILQLLKTTSQEYRNIILNFDKFDKFDNFQCQEIEKLLALPSNFSFSFSFTYSTNTIILMTLLAKKGVDLIVDSSVTEKDAKTVFLSLIDFQKSEGLVPTIVQNKDKEVLMLAYSTKDSLSLSIDSKQSVFFSRSRSKIWKKGEISGNIQALSKIRYDCDCDTLLFEVNQQGFACHTGKFSCFSTDSFSLYKLYEVICSRILSQDSKSYTKKLSLDPAFLLSKIEEESQEVISFIDRNNLIWEIADLTYFLLTLMATKGITPRDVLDELRRRKR